MRMSQKEAAEALGLKRRVVQYYEKGERDGEPLEIPKAVRLACFALTQGVTDYQGLDVQDPAIGAKTTTPDPATETTPPAGSGGKAKSKKRRAPRNRKHATPGAVATADAEDGDQDAVGQIEKVGA